MITTVAGSSTSTTVISPNRPAAVVGDECGEPPQRQRHEHVNGHGDDDGSGQHQISGDRAVRVPDQDTDGAVIFSVRHHVERTVVRRDEAHVENLHYRHQAEKHPHHDSHGSSRPGRQNEASPATTRPSTGIGKKALGVRRCAWFGPATSAKHTSSSASTLLSTVTMARGHDLPGSRSLPASRRSFSGRSSDLPTMSAPTSNLAASARSRHNHHTSRPNDSVSSATARAAYVAVSLADQFARVIAKVR